MNCSSPVPAALMQPQTLTLPPPCLTVGKTHLSLYSSPGCRLTRLTPSEPNKCILVSPQDMVPVIHALSLLVLSKLFAGFLVHHLQKRLPSGTTAMQTNLMRCAAYSLSTDRLTPHPFNLCSNAGSTHTSFSQTQPLDMTLSTCTQILWSTMARSVLSGTCPVKPLYDLGHRAAAQFQGLGNLLIVYASLCRPTIIFFRSSASSLPWGAILNFQWPVWESESQRWKVTNYIYSRYCNWVAFLCTCTFLSNFFNL